MNYLEQLKNDCDYYNSTDGDLNEDDGIECGECKNKGVIYHIKNGYLYTAICKCMQKRKNAHTLKLSGLKDSFERYTFSAFRTDEPFQLEMKNKALKFTKETEPKWFYVGGQVGCGKTMICTAILRWFYEQGMDFYYLNFARDYSNLMLRLSSKFSATQDEALKEYERLVSVKVLYVDDLLKDKQVSINQLFKLINDRYLNRGTITIISSEYYLDELEKLDEAFTRVRERCGEFIISVKRDKKNNQRVIKT